MYLKNYLRTFLIHSGLTKKQLFDIVYEVFDEIAEKIDLDLPDFAFFLSSDLNFSSSRVEQGDDGTFYIISDDDDEKEFWFKMLARGFTICPSATRNTKSPYTTDFNIKYNTNTRVSFIVYYTMLF